MTVLTKQRMFRAQKYPMKCTSSKRGDVAARAGATIPNGEQPAGGEHTCGHRERHLCGAAAVHRRRPRARYSHVQVPLSSILPP